MIDNNGFPAYLGFGRLNPKTITENVEIASTDYYFNDKAVHRLSHNSDTGVWVLKDIFNNTGAISSSDELKKTVLMHFNNLDCKTNSIFQYVRDSICSLGNIYFQNLASMEDADGVASYYPAGRLVIIRVPVFFDDAGRANADTLMNKIPCFGLEKRTILTLNDAYNTSIILPEENGENAVIPVLLLEYIVSLASVFEAVEWMCNNNLISKDRIFRMIIQDSTSKNHHSFLTFEGVKNTDDISYTILLKGINESKIKFEEFEKNWQPD